MKKFRSLLCAIILSSQAMAYANTPPPPPDNNRERTQEEATNKDNIPPSDDLLRNEKIGNLAKPEFGMTDEELLAQPDKLEKLLTIYLAHAQPRQVEHLVKLYQQQNVYRDDSLVEWANAMLLTRKQLHRAIHEYRVLIGKFPDNSYIRYQLATLLYQNQEYDAAEGQFQKLRASPNMTKQDVEVIDKYLNEIARKDKWQFAMGASFIKDKNLNDSADVGTVMTLPNGATLTQTTPWQSGTGLNVNVNTSKKWTLQNGQYVGVEGSANMKYYWDNHGYNELTAYTGANYGYADSNINVRVSPFVMKRLKGEGPNSSSRLHSYTNTFGAMASVDAWLSPQWKQSSFYSYSRERYASDNADKRYGGHLHNTGTGITYFRNAKQYFGTGLNVSKFNAGSDTESYKRYGARVYWGQEWPKGFVTTASAGLYERKFEKPFWGIMRRKDKELNGSVSLWHKAVHAYGITPRITWNYNKRKSNLPIFSYDKQMTYIELEKTF